MKLADFDYELPAHRIAQRPLPQRDASRLLIVRRQDGSLADTRFSELPELLEPGDLMVVNQIRVAPLRLTGTKPTGGRAELTLVHPIGDNLWECLLRLRNPSPGLRLTLGPGVEAVLLAESASLVRTDAREGAPLWKVRFDGDLDRALAERGLPPLPPYIKRRDDEDPEEDRDRYQTVYAASGRAAAAPTAGLHFTEQLLERVRERGVGVERINLEVSFGTFAPVRVENIEDHVMHPERYEVSARTAARIRETKERGGRVIAVGTTSVRTLEHCADEGGRIEAGAGETALFIYPGRRFKVVDVMITNFHMPRSTLLMLVAAFAGPDLIRRAYAYALAHDFRFLSYGDAMIIL